MELLSINVGMPRECELRGKKILSGFFKSPVPGPAQVRLTGILGDGQGDLKYHGGKSKAVYGYGYDAYAWWKKRLKVSSLEQGIFGENLTFSELHEDELGVGDILKIGTCKLQVTEPRMPCSRLGLRFSNPDIVKIFMEGGRPGIYFGVIEEGEIKKGDAATVFQREKVRLPIKVLFEFAKRKNVQQYEILKKGLKISALNSDWKEKIEKALIKVDLKSNNPV